MPDLATVLVIDDEKHNRQLLTEVLTPECRVLLAKNGQQALTLAQEYRPDLILLDVLMPEMNGYEVFQALSQQEITRRIPVIFISALDSPDDEERGLDLGAVDYITKPFHPSIVRKRVRNHLQAAHQRDLLERLAMIDSLTEIANRRRYDEVLLREWRLAASAQQPLSLAVIDVDHFKNYNDHLGHAAGDKVLQQVAQALLSMPQVAGTLVARYGGEEFVVLLPRQTATQAELYAQQICQRIALLAIPHPASAAAGYVTVSVGGITTLPQGDHPTQDFFRYADAQLYQAKRQGRNRAMWGSWLSTSAADSQIELQTL